MSPTKGQITILIQKWHHGDAEAGKKLITITYQKLVNMARQKHRQVGGISLNPQEVVHEAYERIGRAVDQNPPENSLGFYNLASAILHATCVDLLRQRMAIKRQKPVLSLSAGLSQPDHTLLHILTLIDDLQALHPRHAMAFRLHTLSGVSIVETADMLNCSQATVSRDVDFARRWLAVRLQSG
ncbi:sigma-70 family RNA polymerase sigma factor [Marinicella pacifica]|nr:sigma-70 family RNA polymerase sigma factor [Marinicella pacifica]